jgi:hypothetical protein
MSRVARLAAAPAQHPLELKRNAATIPGSLFALGARAAAPGVRMNAFFGVMSTQACVEICRRIPHLWSGQRPRFARARDGVAMLDTEN